MYTIYGNVLNGRVDIQTLANKYYNLSSHVGQLSFHHSSSGLPIMFSLPQLETPVSLPWSLLYATCALVVLRVIISLVKSYRQRQQMPPGPPGLPVIGNVLQMPTAFPWLRFTEWKKQYGAYSPGISYMKSQLMI